MTQIIATIEDLVSLRDALRAAQAQAEAEGHKQIRLCTGASCIASGALGIRAALENELHDRNLHYKVSVIGTGCLGPCSAGPAMIVGDVFYEGVKPEDCKEIVAEHLVKGRPVGRLTHKRSDGRSVPSPADIDFFRKQKKIVLRNCGVIDPLRIEDYIAHDGYQALAAALRANDPEKIIQTLKTSGLRGRGGAGFPTWRKWKLTARRPRRAEVRRLQRRRRRPRRVHGPQRPGRRSPQRDRGHGRRRPHDRRVDGLHLRPRRVSAGRRAAADRHRAMPRAGTAGQEHPGHGLRLRPGDPHGFRGVRSPALPAPSINMPTKAVSH